VLLGANTLTINTGAVTVANFGGAISGTGAVIKTGLGAEIFSGNSTYSGGTTVLNGALILTGSIDSAGNTTVNGGVFDVADHGSLTTATTTVNGGALDLAEGSSFASPTLNVGPAGTVNAGGASATVATYNNAGVLNLRNGAPGSTFTLSGAYNGMPGSQLQVGVNFATGAADKLVVASATGTTPIVVTDSAPTSPAAFNPTGIVVVASSGAMSSTAFTLAGGPVQKGLFQYDLAFTPDPHFLLVTVPTAEAFRLGTLPTAAQSIWQDSAGVWLDRQSDLRDLLIAGIPLSGPTAAGGTAPTMDTGVWARAFGDWANRSQTQTYSDLNKTYTYQTGYDQNTGGIYSGIDGGKQNLLSNGDAVLVGLTVGYVNSAQSFKGSATTVNYQGGSFGLSATYLNKNLFVDVLAKADILTLNYNNPSLAPFGTSQQNANVVNLGIIADAGYRLDFAGTGFVEPLATLAAVSSRIQGLSLAGAQIGFSDGADLRGRIGVRGGATVLDNADMRIVCRARPAP
jgi:outer membrane autotransporter protein